jgi:hypothetical protein
MLIELVSGLAANGMQDTKELPKLFFLALSTTSPPFPEAPGNMIRPRAIYKGGIKRPYAHSELFFFFP